METFVACMYDKPLAVVTIAVVSALAGFLGSWFTFRATARNKQADLIVHFHKQFDELQKKRAEILVAQAERVASEDPDANATLKNVSLWSDKKLTIEAQVFFDRFWSLQFDEFHAWYEGYLPTSLYTYWAFARWRQLHDSSEHSADWLLDKRTVAGSLDELWKRWHFDSGSSTHVMRFIGLMFALKENGNHADPDIARQLRRYGPSLRRRCVRRLLGTQ
jgi:hypothetical protein